MSQKFFWAKHFFDPKFISQLKIFGPKFSQTQKFLQAHNFFEPKIFLGPQNFFLTKNFLQPQNSLTQYFLGLIHKPNWQIQTMLVNQSKQESNQGKKV